MKDLCHSFDNQSLNLADNEQEFLRYLRGVCTLLRPAFEENIGQARSGEGNGHTQVQIEAVYLFLCVKKGSWAPVMLMMLIYVYLQNYE